ncbi:MAG: bifunctional folylpolyglutamate synthase/dihydrofolate synthase [Kiritimatiellae bacterium]|nr:bifunctional folylpolyglutamate synthase/dihydrofolate synthase [Kiritimatiellia bacterium]
MSKAADTQVDALVSRLYQRNLHTIKLSLDVVAELLRELGNPQDAFLSIHIAGTNGKGSTSAMLASILKAAGFRVGLYTSPHLRRFNERVQVDGEPIRDGDLLRAMEAVELAAARVRKAGGRDVTFFEFTTALAFWWFRQCGVQVAVLETGMGGRLDATNVVTPIVSVITSIGLDHQAYLGDTLEEIAGEKAGIIKLGRPVVCGQLPEAALNVVREAARARAARLTVASEVCAVTRNSQTLEGQRLTIETASETIGRVTCPLLGRYQLINIAVAIAALQEFAAETSLPISEEAIREGLRHVVWPARLQILSRDPLILLDGAHNVEAMTNLRRTVEELSEGRPVGVLASFLADKNAVGCLRVLAPIARRCWLVPCDGARAMSQSALASAARQAEMDAEVTTLKPALAAARAWAQEESGVVLIAGSFYLAGEVLAATAAD